MDVMKLNVRARFKLPFSIVNFWSWLWLHSLSYLVFYLASIKKNSLLHVSKCFLSTILSRFHNSEARSESECIRCFCFGKSNQCRSADLFTYNMPTPLGEGGTRLLGIKHSPTGDVSIDSSQPISNQYYYQPLRNGATVSHVYFV